MDNGTMMKMMLPMLKELFASMTLSPVHWTGAFQNTPTSVTKGMLTDKSDAIGSCNLKPNDNDNENDDNLSSN